MINPIKSFAHWLMGTTNHAPVILQLSNTECGIASLAMIFSYYEVNVSLEQLREKCGTSRDGCKAQTLLMVARHYGFDANAYKVDIDELLALTHPVIAYWNFNHYVVINRVDNKFAYINDPGHGTVKVSMQDLDRAFTGIILVLTPTEKMIAPAKLSNPIAPFYQWLNHFKKELLYILLCLLVTLALPYLNTFLTTTFIDYCLILKANDWIPYLAALTIFANALYLNANIHQKIIQFKLYTKASLLICSNIIAHMLRVPLIFYSLRQRSEIIATLSRAESVTTSLIKNALSISTLSIALVTCVAFMFYLSSSLALISLSMSGIYFFILTVSSRTSLLLEKHNLNASGKLFSHTLSTFRNIETIKACGLESTLLTKWHLLLANKVTQQDKSNTLDIRITSLCKSYQSTAALTLIIIGIHQVATSKMSIGSLMSYGTLQMVYYQYVLQFFQATKDLQRAYVTSHRIHDLSSYTQDKRFIMPTPLIPQEDTINAKLICSDVSFYYNAHSPPTLKNINLSLSSGEHIAFVGGTGSGKSTLAKLLCALYQPQSGHITWQDKNLSDYSAPALARLFAYVSQDSALFSGTIFDNLTMYNPRMQASQIHQTLELVCLTTFMTAKTLYSPVEEGGKNFSGGELQRLDIARALLQNTPFLILDEATSALDTQTERTLIANLRKTNKTIIYIAHRLSTIQHCDQIFVMHNGAIIEHGSHQALMKQGQYYFSLIKKEHCFDGSVAACQ